MDDAVADRPGTAAGRRAEILLRLAGIHKAYKGTVAVDHVDLDVRRGEFFTLLGPSGSGKTTTLRLVAGFEQPDRGTILLDSQDVAGLPPFERSVNTVFQDYALFPHMSVAENVAYGLDAKRVRGAERAERVAEALRMVRLADLGTRLPTQLSGGQRQRVGLARAIVNRPALLLLDEPLGALDLKLRQEMQVELKHIQEKVGISFLYVTHDQEEALSMSDRIAIFNRGRIEQVGSPVEVYEHPATAFVAGFVGTASLVKHDGRRLVLRPERVRIVPAGGTPAAGLATATGRLVEIVYLGMFTRYLVTLDDGQEVIAMRPNVDGRIADPGLAPGQRVIVAWDPERAAALPGTD